MIDPSPWLAALPPPLRPLAWRAHPLDGKLLLFEREHGLNALLESPETAAFVRQPGRRRDLALR